MSAPVPFDPVSYVSDMHDVGAALVPYTISNGRRVFGIYSADNLGVPANVLTVAARYEDAALAHLDWRAAVHDALIARRGGL